MYRLFYLFLFYLIPLNSIEAIQEAKDNGDIYIVKEEAFIKDVKQKSSTESTLLLENSNTNVPTNTKQNSYAINFDEVISMCNSSFYIPMSYYTSFNTTAELPDLVDKTGMCFIRCIFEKSGLIENWKLNADKIRANIWPAMGDTIEVCQKEAAQESNGCVRAYGIAKCLTLRSLTDAKNKPVYSKIYAHL